MYNRPKSVYEGTYEADVLACLVEVGPLPPSKVKMSTGLTSVQVKRTLSNLKRKGLVWFKSRKAGSTKGEWRVTNDGFAAYHDS